MPANPSLHELPRLYLRGFCTQDASRLWVFRLGMPFQPGTKPHLHNPVLRGLRQVALRPDRYLARDRTGALHYSYELRLQQQEHLADEVLARVRRCEPIDDDGKVTLARYALLTLRRLSSRDQALRRTIPPVSQFSPEADFARALASQGRFGDAHEILKTIQWHSTQAGQVELLRESMLQPQPRVEALLLRRRWQFLVASRGGFFVSCDRPVVFDPRGLRYSSLLFPLSSRVMVEAGAQGGEGRDLSYREVGPDELQRLNFLVLFHARQEVYAPEPSEWIHSEWTAIPKEHRIV